MQSYVYVLGSAAGGGRCECMRRKESASVLGRRWGMSARIAKLTIAQDSYRSALRWGDHHLLPPPLPLTTSSRKESGRLDEEERTRLMNRSSIRKRSRIPFAQLNQQSYPYYPFVSQRNEYIQGLACRQAGFDYGKDSRSVVVGAVQAVRYV